MAVFEEDFDERLARRKIQQFGRTNPAELLGRRSGYLMKREVVNRLGPIREEESFTIASGLQPQDTSTAASFVYQEHMDDPRAPQRIQTEEDFQRLRPLSAQTFKVNSREEWIRLNRHFARSLQACSFDPVTTWAGKPGCGRNSTGCLENPTCPRFPGQRECQLFHTVRLWVTHSWRNLRLFRCMKPYWFGSVMLVWLSLLTPWSSGQTLVTDLSKSRFLTWTNLQPGNLVIIERSTNLVASGWRPYFYGDGAQGFHGTQLPFSAEPIEFYRTVMQTNVPDPSLILSLSFDNDISTGVVLDVSGHGNHGLRFGRPCCPTIGPR
jgi:hypothetical protein